MSALAVEERLVDKLAGLARAYAESQAFVTLLAHELRTRLKVTELALATTGDCNLETAREHTRRVQQLVESLLELARGDAGGSADAGASASSVIRELETDLERLDARITVRALPVVPLPAGLLETILRNLIVNALEAGAKEIEISARGDGTITVRDDGPGVQPDELDLIFGVYSGKPGGAGLGLALCREILRRRGGNVWLEPPSTFAFRVG